MVWLAFSHILVLHILLVYVPAVHANGHKSPIGNHKFENLQESVDVEMETRPVFNFAKDHSDFSTYGTSSTSYYFNAKRSRSPSADGDDLVFGLLVRERMKKKVTGGTTMTPSLPPPNSTYTRPRPKKAQELITASTALNPFQGFLWTNTKPSDTPTIETTQSSTPTVDGKVGKLKYLFLAVRACAISIQLLTFELCFDHKRALKLQ